MSKYTESTIDWLAGFDIKPSWKINPTEIFDTDNWAETLDLSIRELFPSAFEGDEFVGSFSIDTTTPYINVNALGDFEPDPSTISDKDREAMINKAREAREDRVWARKMREAERKRKEWEASPEGKWALWSEKQAEQRKLDERNKRFEKIEAKRLKEKKKREERKAFEARVKRKVTRVKREVSRALKQRELKHILKVEELKQKESDAYYKHRQELRDEAVRLRAENKSESFKKIYINGA